MKQSVKKFFRELSSHTMDMILFIIFVTLVIFTIFTLWLFVQFQTIPDTLVTCVFTSLASECGIMGWIKTAKEKTKRESGQVDSSDSVPVSDMISDDPLANNSNEPVG